MTIEQIQQLSELTQKAIDSNNMESLQNIFDIIKDYQLNGEIKNDMLFEWFYSMVPVEMLQSLK